MPGRAKSNSHEQHLASWNEIKDKGPEAFISPGDQISKTWAAVKSNLTTALEDHKKSTNQCEICGTSPRFFKWTLCWDCGTELLGRGTEVIGNWDVLAAHKGDFFRLSTVEANFDFDDVRKDLVGKTFRESDFTGASFRNIDFSRCKFERVDFTGATFVDCSFRKAVFDSCAVRFTKFVNTDFRAANLTTLQLLRCIFQSRTVLSHCRFENTKFFETYFDDCQLQSCKFAGSNNLRRTIFSNCDLSGSDLTCAEFHELGITKKSNVAALRLTVNQRKRVEFSADTDSDKVIYVLARTWSLARQGQHTFWQEACLRDVCGGFTDNLEVVLNCIAAGSLVGIAYCIVSGAFHESGSLLLSFLWPTAISSTLLLVPGLFASARIVKKQRQGLI